MSLTDAMNIERDYLASADRSRFSLVSQTAFYIATNTLKNVIGEQTNSPTKC